jgi:probable F420-dependent oxidoreductase
VTIKVGIQAIPQGGDFGKLRDTCLEADALGADMVLVPDHFFPIFGDLDGPTFECLSLVSALAALTSNARIGTLVVSNSYRNPHLLANMARTIDHISGGRFMLGLGSGYHERDYLEYGYEFGTPGSRLAALEDNIPVIRGRLAKLNPPPVGPIPLLIGASGEKVALRIVATYADIWFHYGDVTEMARKSEVLDAWCKTVGRDPAEIVRATTVHSVLGRRDPEALLELGFTEFVITLTGPDWDLAPLLEFLAWRDSLQ